MNKRSRSDVYLDDRDSQESRSTAALLLAVRALYAAIERFDGAAAEQLAVDRTSLRAINAMERGAVSPGALGAALALTSGSVTALLDRLERAGHVQRTQSDADGRRRDARLSASTRKRADRIYATLGATIEKTFCEHSTESLQATIAVVQRLAAAFDAASVDAATTDSNERPKRSSRRKRSRARPRTP